MASKPRKQSSETKKKKKVERSTTATTTSSSEELPSSSLASTAQVSSTIFPDLSSPAASAPEREVSAEEVFQASINFRTSHSLSSGDGFDASAVSERFLYPSMDQMPVPIRYFDEEEKEEVRAIPIVAMAVPEEEKQEAVGVEAAIAVATVATAVPTSAAAVYIESDDDPVTRKVREEERIMNHARVESLVDPTEVITEATFEGEEWAEDAKPAAQVAYASTAGDDSEYREITEHEVHPANMENGVQAELVGEADCSFQHAVATPMMATAAVTHDDLLAEEATAFDLKPAPAPAGWANEESAEATVLGTSPQDQMMYTTETHNAVLEEFAVNGVDEAEAMVVEFAEDYHPSDLEATGVEAELIGRDYSHGGSLQNSQAWIEQAEQTNVTSDFAVATATGVAPVDNYDMVDRAAQVTVVDISQEAGINANEAHATIVDISEDVHPADLDVAGAHAELVGDQEARPWGEPENHAIVADATAFATATAAEFDVIEEYGGEVNAEAQATVVSFAEDFHPSDFQVSGVRAELVGREFVRAESLSETLHAQTLPIMSSPVLSTPRSISAPDCHNANPFEDGLEDTPAMLRDGILALDAMESSPYQTQPTKFISPPPIPSRSAASRAQSHTSVGSRMSSLSSSGEGGGTGTRHAGMAQAVSISGNQGGEGLSPTQRATQQVLSNVARSRTNVVRTTNNVIERLFGGESSRRSHDFDIANAAGSILPRTLLPWSVFPSETTGMWVATVNTNQKALDSNNVEEASKALRAFSVPTKQQAEALARAWAPPRMLPFPDNPKCFVCEAKFAVFKRPCHCRNCGVCICSSCAVQWPSKMIPDTYNIKKETMINICKSCDWLCSAFRMAMLEGRHDRAVAIHATSNVNLVTPFANVKGELFYPVHCAVLGGSLELLQWLVDTHCCPLRSIRISGKTRQSSGSFTPVLTSRGRSLLGIAMEKEKIDLVRYLVVDKGMPLTGEKDLNMGTLIRILDRLLRTIPANATSAGQLESNSQRSLPNGSSDRLAGSTASLRPFGSPLPDASVGRQTEESWRADEALAYELAEQSRREEDSQGSVEDACIICFANSIDCVVTPCGHQICCMTCSKNISRCPVCGVDCSFIKVFRANA